MRLKFILFLVGCTAFVLQGSAQKQLTEVDSIVANLSKKLKEQYVFPGKGLQVANKLEAAHQTKKYAALKKDDLAAMLTRDLQEWSGDKHFNVRYSPDVLSPVEELQMEIPANEKAAYGEYLRHDNYGINKLEVLKGNIGYIDFKYLCTPEFAGDSYAAMMNYVANTEALIIDLRQCGGSTSPDAIPFICSYLFEKPVHLNDLYWRKNNITNQSWTYSYVPGKRFINKPVYVLTSNATFSGAEEMAYDLKNLKRAILFGDRTGGGANPGGVLTISNHFSVFMPVGQAINPITKTNWEGVGVTPDSLMNPGKALYAATLAALNHIKISTNDEGWKNYVAQVMSEVKQNAPVYKPVVFELNGYQNAKQVSVAGNFNGWSKNATTMKKEGGKWIATAEAEPGKVYYKFIVDGAWMTDPGNKETQMDGANTNSVKMVSKDFLRLLIMKH